MLAQMQAAPPKENQQNIDRLFELVSGHRAEVIDAITQQAEILIYLEDGRPQT
jgi:hypothetical protein